MSRREQEIEEKKRTLEDMRRKNQLVQDKVQEQIKTLTMKLEELRVEHQTNEASADSIISCLQDKLIQVGDRVEHSHWSRYFKILRSYWLLRQLSDAIKNQLKALPLAVSLWQGKDMMIPPSANNGFFLCMPSPPITESVRESRTFAGPSSDGGDQGHSLDQFVPLSINCKISRARKSINLTTFYRRISCPHNTKSCCWINQSLLCRWNNH